VLYSIHTVTNELTGHHQKKEKEMNKYFSVYKGTVLIEFNTSEFIADYFKGIEGYTVVEQSGLIN
jgi:hypothetical protein